MCQFSAVPGLTTMVHSRLLILSAANFAGGTLNEIIANVGLKNMSACAVHMYKSFAFCYFPCMSYFTMNQDAQIFNDNQECLNDQYLNAQLAEHHTRKDENEQNAAHASGNLNDSNTAGKAQATAAEASPEKKEALNWAHPRFTMSQFQLYETKTVRHYIVRLHQYISTYHACITIEILFSWHKSSTTEIPSTTNTSYQP